MQLNHVIKWQVLGTVTIDTARLLLIDPIHENAEFSDLEEGQITLPGGDYQALVVRTGLGDGRYRVEGRYAETRFGRRLAEIRIRFVGVDGEWLGADNSNERNRPYRPELRINVHAPIDDLAEMIEEIQHLCSLKSFLGLIQDRLDDKHGGCPPNVVLEHILDTASIVIDEVIESDEAILDSEGSIDCLLRIKVDAPVVDIAKLIEAALSSSVNEEQIDKVLSMVQTRLDESDNVCAPCDVCSHIVDTASAVINELVEEDELKM